MTDEQTVNLHETTDASVWAAEFCRIFPNTGISEGCMIGWFANAMMAKADAMQARAEKAEVERDTAWNDAIEAAIDRIDGSWTWDDADFMAEVYDDLRRNLKKGEPT